MATTKLTDTQKEALISAAREQVAKNIAKRVFLLDTLAAQNSDRLDFHEVAVWQIARALREAWDCGREYGLQHPRKQR